MKKCWIILSAVMVYSGYVLAATCTEQEAKEQMARQFLVDTSPRATNGHPKAADNLIEEQVYTGTRTAPVNTHPIPNDYVEEIE